MSHLKSLLLGNFSHVNLGLLLIRIGVGLSLLLFHGWGKITGGPELWARIGENMGNLGIHVFPTFWGFMAAFSEFFGGAFLVLGVLFRPAAALVAFTMLVAAIRHLSLPPDAAAAGFQGASHALEILAVSLGLLFSGPGTYHVGRLTRA